MEEKIKANARAIIEPDELNDTELDQISGGTRNNWARNTGPLHNLDIKTFTRDTLTILGRVASKPDSPSEDNS